MNMQPTKSAVLFGELSYCVCGGTEHNGHTFACILEQYRRRKMAKQTPMTKLVNATGLSENTICKVVNALAELSVTEQQKVFEVAAESEQALQDAVKEGSRELLGEPVVEKPSKNSGAANEVDKIDDTKP